MGERLRGVNVNGKNSKKKFFLKKLPSIRTYSIHRQWAIIWFYCQGLGKNSIERLIIRKSGKEVNEQTFSNRNHVKVLVSCVNAYQRAYIIAKALSNGLDKMRHSGYVSLFPSYLCAFSKGP